MNEREPLLILYDMEEEYTMLMSEYLEGYPGVPWKIHSYTREEELIRQEKNSAISILLVSEHSYSDRLKELNAEKLVILNESGYRPEDTLECIDKYQAAEIVTQILLQAYIEIAGEQPGKITDFNKTRFIGVYSPIKRCLQTTFAITMSQVLAEKKRTLYLNFETYCGMAELLSKDGDRDLADLIYFLNVDNDKFMLHLQTMVKQAGSMEYVPPMKYGNNILSITEGDWMNLLKRISESGMFDYVVMDLTDSIQGLTKILRVCSRVYTLMKEDRLARNKMEQYERMLEKYDCTDIIEKTKKFVFPKFHYIPMTLEQFSRGEVAEFVRSKVLTAGVG